MHISSWQAAYRGQLPDEFLAGLAERRTERVANWHAAIAAAGPRVLVAERGGDIVGFVSFGPSRDPDPTGPGEVYAIYVQPSAWDIGAGRALMLAALDGLRALGFGEAVLWVLASNERARRFYERGGWRPDGVTKLDRRGDIELHEARYRRTLERVR